MLRVEYGQSIGEWGFRALRHKLPVAVITCIMCLCVRHTETLPIAANCRSPSVASYMCAHANFCVIRARCDLIDISWPAVDDVARVMQCGGAEPLRFLLLSRPTKQVLATGTHIHHSWFRFVERRLVDFRSDRYPLSHTSNADHGRKSRMDSSFSQHIFAPPGQCAVGDDAARLLIDEPFRVFNRPHRGAVRELHSLLRMPPPPRQIF